MSFFSSYSVIVNDKLRDNILSIPCSGKQIAQAVSQNLNALFPDSVISIEEFQGLSILDRLKNRLMQTTNAPSASPSIPNNTYVAESIVEEELEKELFAI